VNIAEALECELSESSQAVTINIQRHRLPATGIGQPGALDAFGEARAAPATSVLQATPRSTS